MDGRTLDSGNWALVKTKGFWAVIFDQRPESSVPSLLFCFYRFLAAGFAI
jgi:hypothetical protein